MTAVILTDTTTGATAPSDDSISVVEINTAVINSSGDAFDFDSTENSSVIVAGIIAAESASGIFGDAGAIGADVTVSGSGIVSGEDTPLDSHGAVYLEGANSVVTNEGLIESDTFAVYASGDGFVLRNTGIIAANVNYAIENSLSFGVFIAGVSSAEITNAGVISAGYYAVSLTGADENAVFTISNTGLIDGHYLGAIDFDRGELQLYNSGDIIGAIRGIYIDDGDLILENIGTISAYEREAIDLAVGTASITNSGEISSVLGVGIAAPLTYLQNSGLISGVVGISINGTVDSVYISNTGEIASSAGDDAIYVNPNLDVSLTLVSTGVISGTIDLGAGGDVILISGEGVATGDILTAAGQDYVQGGQFIDRMNGGTGIDILLGGGGADVITGGDDIDFLLGEEGADVFLFTTISDSAVGEADSILDFEQGEDIIDLYTIETSIAFLGSGAFTGSGGAELRATNVGGVLSIVDFDVDGNGAADMQFIVYGALDMTRADFGL